MVQLHIANLHASVGKIPILNGVTLKLDAGSIHAIMGPNGSGKSTLAYTLAGHPDYSVTAGSVEFVEDSHTTVRLLELSPDERSQAGLFLAFQYPVEVPGVSVRSFLREAYRARFAHQPEKHRISVTSELSSRSSSESIGATRKISL